MRHRGYRRTMTEDYLNQRLPRNNTVAMNQNYVTNVMENSRTSKPDREAVVDYVMTHPERFTARCDRTGDGESDEWARKKNGGASFYFMGSFVRKYAGQY